MAELLGELQLSGALMTGTISVFIAAFLVITGCSGAKNRTERQHSGNDVKLVEGELRKRGLTILRVETVDQPFFTPQGKAVIVDHEQMIQVFEFTNVEEAENVRSTISPDGMTIATSKPFWAEPPHFFHRERLLVLYVGQDNTILSALEAVFGPQFAGK